ncbi:hypothetical protein AAHE18_02G090500 [Arachis hypogaea]
MNASREDRSSTRRGAEDRSSTSRGSKLNKKRSRGSKLICEQRRSKLIREQRLRSKLNKGTHVIIEWIEEPETERNETFGMDCVRILLGLGFCWGGGDKRLFFLLLPFFSAQ